MIRPRGNRGELLAISQTDVPGRLESLQSAQIRLRNGSDVEVQIEESWPHGANWVFKFAGVDSIDAADRFRGADLWVPRSERAQLPEGECFRTDLLGCQVVDIASAEVLGEVEGFQQYGGPLLLEMKRSGREVLIPFVPEICPQVDFESRRIGVILPAGLLDL